MCVFIKCVLRVGIIDDQKISFSKELIFVSWKHFTLFIINLVKEKRDGKTRHDDKNYTTE